MAVGPPWISTSSGGTPSSGAIDVGVCRRVVQAVRGALAVGSGRERDRPADGEPVRFESEVAGRAQDLGRAGDRRARRVVDGDLDDLGLAVEAGAHEHHGVVPHRQRGDLGVRQSEGGDGAVEARTARWSSPSLA